MPSDTAKAAKHLEWAARVHGQAQADADADAAAEAAGEVACEAVAGWLASATEVPAPDVTSGVNAVLGQSGANHKANSQNLDRLSEFTKGRGGAGEAGAGEAAGAGEGAAAGGPEDVAAALL